MAASVYVCNFVFRPRGINSFKGMLFYMPTSLAFLSSLLIFFYISSTSRLLIHLHTNPLHVTNKVEAITKPFPYVTKPMTQFLLPKELVSDFPASNASTHFAAEEEVNGSFGEDETAKDSALENDSMDVTEEIVQENDSKKNADNKYDQVFHDETIFQENYKEMNRSLKIFIYPHNHDDPFANVLLPVSKDPGGNYASENYFKKALFKSHFITKDPSEADYFFLPFSITNLRNDKRIGVGGIRDFVRDYIGNVKSAYPFWNRTGGSDHFYVACHSIGKIAMDKATEVRTNAIQVVCSSNYFVTGYVAHKDVPLPQIWPRQGDPPLVDPSKRDALSELNFYRKRLAFFAGANNCPVRRELVRVWGNDTEIFANPGRLKTPYWKEHLRSKYCLHVKGFEVNTARIGDALYYGCVPVVLADHYELPFSDIFNWESFSVVVHTTDIPNLKRILKGIGEEDYLKMQRNVLKVRRHFQWHGVPVEFDAFYMVMYELWLRRSSIPMLL